MRRLILLAAATLVASPASAKDKPPVFVETQPVKDKPAIVLDPAKAYVLLRSDVQVPLSLMKVASAEDQAAYDKLKAAALAESHEKYARKIANFERDKMLVGHSPDAKPPVEPTEKNFEFVSFGMMATVSIGPVNRFAKGKDTSVYLQELTPGAYRVYGLMFVNPGVAAVGSCFCMGSVKFEAKAGEVTDLGAITVLPPSANVAGDSSHPVDASEKPLFTPTPTGTSIDPRLASAHVVPARFHPVGKLPNYFGLTITRMPAMPGVMRYDRDRIVDLTGGE